MKTLTFGSAMVDIIAILVSDSVEKITLSNAHSQYLLIEPGRKVEAEEIETHIGGGGLNTAVSFARLGAGVKPMVKVGDDASKDHVLRHCKAFGLDTTAIVVDPAQATGSAVMIATHERNAAIFTRRGANTCLSVSDLGPEDHFKEDLIHAAPLSGASALVLPEIAKRAENTFFSCNPGIRQLTTRTASVLAAGEHMDLIAINDLEAAALVPVLSAMDPTFQWQTPSPQVPAIRCEGQAIGLASFARALSKQGPSRVLITHGAGGAYLFADDVLYHQPVVPVEVAGTAGAGDAFVSTLAFFLASGFSPEPSLRLAAHNAASVVSHVNTTDGLLELDTLKARAGN